MPTPQNLTHNTMRSDAAVISLVGVTHFVSHFFHLVVPPLFPWLMPAFNINFIEAGALMSTFFVISGVGQVLAGELVDRFSPRPVLLGGVFLLALSGLLLAVAQNYTMLMLAAVIAGLGNCVFHPVDFTILNQRVSPARLGHAFAVHGITGYIGWAAAPLIMTAIAAVAAENSWRFAAFAASALAFLVLAFLYTQRHVLDAAQQTKATNTTSQNTSAAALSTTPSISSLSILRSPTVCLCFLFFFLTTASFGALQNFAPTALQAVYALSLPFAATCLSAYMLGAALGTFAGGFLAQWQAQDKIIIYCLSAGALICLAQASGIFPAAAVLPLMSLMGFSIGVAAPSRDLLVRKAATQGLGQASYGRIYGLVYSGMDAGQALSPVLFGALMDGGNFAALWIGMATLQALAIGTAVYVLRFTHAAQT